MSNLKNKISKNAAEAQIALICKQILNTKWHEYRKRKKLLSKAKAIAEEYDIEL